MRERERASVCVRERAHLGEQRIPDSLGLVSDEADARVLVQPQRLGVATHT